jgi:FkbM family methyltransferase
MPLPFTKRIKESVRKLLPTQIRRHAILAGPLRGQRIVTSWHDYPGAILGTTERPLLDWFTRHAQPGSTWLDIGSHYGYTAIALARLVGPGGRVFAFEPVVSTAGCLAQTRAVNGLEQLTVVPLALGPGEELKSLRLPAVRGMADSTLNGANPVKETIYSISFDVLWSSISGDNSAIHGVKIDVQGMELPVLLGMRQALLRCAPTLVVEFHAGVDRREVLDFLAACGYSTTAEPISPGGPAGLLADDASYVFRPLRAACVSSSTPFSIARN